MNPEPASSSASGSSAWPSTRVSWVEALPGGGEAAHYKMLVDLALRYRSPILRRIRADAPDLSLQDAEDICGDYFHIVLMGRGKPEKSLLHRFDRNRGRLRTFISSTLARFLSSWRRHRSASRRDARLTCVAEDLLEVQISPEPGPDALFDRFWGQDILSKAVAATEVRWSTPERVSRFQALKPWLLLQEEPGSLKEIAAHLSIPAATLRQTLTTLRREYREEVLRAINPTVASPRERETEFRHLMDALLGNG